MKSLGTNDDKPVVALSFWNDECLFTNDEWENGVAILEKKRMSQEPCVLCGFTN